MNKKKIQIAFAVVLVILSIASTFIEGRIMYNIILAVIVPSFILTIISFIDEIIERCEINSNAFSESCIEFSRKQLEDAEQQVINSDETDPGVIENFRIRINACKSIHQTGVDYSEAKAFFEKCRSILFSLSIVGYVILFLSLIFSPYIIDWLSYINLNCLTMWSLTILYFNIELKAETADKILTIIVRRFVSKNKESTTSK